LVVLDVEGEIWRALVAQRGFRGEEADVSIDAAGAFVFSETD
jgi:hypothetical protein